MEALLGKSLEELQAVAIEAGLPRFVGKQLCEWIYRHRATSFDQMTNLSLRARQALQQHYVIGRITPTAEAVSIDGTRKYLFPVLTAQRSNSAIECVYLPEDDRTTLCVSTQAGCKMGCRFCMTGTLGFNGNLTAADILAQVLYFPDLTNLVLMGEGEPMDNLDSVLRALNVLTTDWGLGWSPKRITVSTVGVPAMKRFLDESECHLAVSLHNPVPAERAAIMPAERLMSVTDVVALIKQYDWSHQRRVSFEYICWSGVNDDLPHAKQLLRLLQGLPCRINLIRFHAGVDREFPASDETAMEHFRDYLSAHGITTTIRKSRGEDILAACGMLVNALNRQ